MTVSMKKSEITLGIGYYILSYFFLPYLLSYFGIVLSIPQWCCQVALFFLNFLFSIIIFRRFLLNSGKAALRFVGKFCGYTFLGLVFYFTANFAVVCLIHLIRPEFTNLNDAGIVSLAENGGLWIAVSSVFFVPVAEELLFRGLLFDALGEKHPVAAWFISASAFSAAHIVGYIGAYDAVSFVLAFVQYLPAGLCLSYAYKASGTIFAPILMHTIINIIGVITLL